MGFRYGLGGAIALGIGIGVGPAYSAPEIEPLWVEQSPVLQRWLVNPPNVLADIYQEPSFRTKLRLGVQGRDRLGWDIALEDAWLGDSAFTVSAGYQRDFSGPEQDLHAGVRYYLRPRGSYWNLAPHVGYRHWEHPAGATHGWEVGFQTVLALSPRSADLRLSQLWAAPGTATETGTTQLSASYALSRHLWVRSHLQWRRSPQQADSRAGFALEWAF